MGGWTGIGKDRINWDGQIEQKELTPIKENDLVNKKYVDDNDFWLRDANGLYPKTLTDDVGIGTATPSDPLHIYRTSGNASFKLETIDKAQSKFILRNLRTDDVTQVWSFTSGTTGDFTFANSTDATNPFQIKALAPTTALLIGSAETVFNEGGADQDFRVESDVGAHGIFMNGANGKVGLNENNPQYNLHMTSDTGIAECRIESGGASSTRVLLKNSVRTWNFAVDSSGSFAVQDTTGGSVSPFKCLAGAPGNALKISTNQVIINDGRADIDLRVEGDTLNNLLHTNAGLDRVGINTASPDTRLQVVGDFKTGDDNTNYAKFDTDGELTLTGTARVKKTKTFTFNYAQITGKGKPTLVSRGVFFGWSLPIFDSDDEELYSCSCAPADWDGVSDPVFSVAGWLDTANTDKKFNIQCSVETYDPVTNEVVPITVNSTAVETDTGTAAQYTSFFVSFTLDASAIGFTAGKPIGIRIRRLDASTNEIAGEFVVEGAVVEYVSNKLGEAT